jgi:hypothetical protein
MISYVMETVSVSSIGTALNSVVQGMHGELGENMTRDIDTPSTSWVCLFGWWLVLICEKSIVG